MGDAVNRDYVGMQDRQILDAKSGSDKREIKATDISRAGQWDDFVIGPQGKWLAVGAVDEQEGSVELFDLEGA